MSIIRRLITRLQGAHHMMSIIRRLRQITRLIVQYEIARATVEAVITDPETIASWNAACKADPILSTAWTAINAAITPLCDTLAEIKRT